MILKYLSQIVVTDLHKTPSCQTLQKRNLADTVLTKLRKWSCLFEHTGIMWFLMDWELGSTYVSSTQKGE